MFYGLEESYWDTFLSERRSPVLVQRLRELGYRIDANAGREVGMFDMRNATFVAQTMAQSGTLLASSTITSSF